MWTMQNLDTGEVVALTKDNYPDWVYEQINRFNDDYRDDCRTAGDIDLVLDGFDPALFNEEDRDAYGIGWTQTDLDDLEAKVKE